MWLLGVELWHHINDAPWLGGPVLQCSVKGAARLAPLSSCLDKRDPVMIEHLCCLHWHLDLMNSFDISVFAITCIVFWCCCRLCELLIDSSFDPTAHVSCSAPVKCGIAANGC